MLLGKYNMIVKPNSPVPQYASITITKPLEVKLVLEQDAGIPHV